MELDCGIDYLLCDSLEHLSNAQLLNLNTLNATEMQARKEFGEAFKAMQVDSVINGTDKMTLDEINDIISETRREASTAK